MIADLDLKPYPAMKDSGVEWLGEVPDHWEVRRLKQAFQRIIGGGTPASGESSFWDGEVVWITPADVSKRQRLTTSARTLTEGGLQACSAELAPSGSIIVTSRAPVGNVALTATELCTNQGCKSLITDGRVIDSEFGFVVMQTLKHELQSLATGTTFTEISTNKLGLVPFPLPPLPEQTAIVRFLDYVDQRIRRYIHTKQRLIGLLEEQKQAIIHRAVTRGLDPDVPLKPSGVEWLGDVPEHWEVVPIKRAFSSMDYGISESGSNSGVIRLLTMGHLKDGCVRVPADGGVDSIDSSLLLQAGDLLFNRTNSPDLVGKVGLFLGHASPVTFASYLVRMRPRPNHTPEYLNAVLNDAIFLSIVRREAIPSLHQSNLNPTRYGRLHIALPPQNEQQAILQVLQQETERLVAGIMAARREIELLREYRIRLIADVVTGKLDVREAAASLPNEPDELELDNEIDNLGSNENIDTIENEVADDA